LLVLMTPLTIPGSWSVENTLHGDHRGDFVEWFKAPQFEATTGRSFALAQANMSRSSKGTLRGIHFADVPIGQAKYITCVVGSIIDFVVDIRVGSPTFGSWDALELSGSKRNAVFLEEGLGHAFLALEDDTVVTYLVTDVYRPDKEHGINPLDPAIGLSFPFPVAELELSAKDQVAPSLQEAQEDGLLPLWSGQEG
jgi:dTDP-4-dehydrorhamnose 3,5-epimerase